MAYDEYGGSQWEAGSPNVNRAYQRLVEAGEAPDNSWLDRLFQRKQAPITQQPLPPMVATDEGRFPPQAAPSPFGGGNAGQRARPKPASKLSSADEIAQRAGQFMSPWTTQNGATDPSQFMSPWTMGGSSPPEAQAGQFMSPWTTQGGGSEPPMRDPGETGGWPMMTPRERIDMRGESPSADLQQNRTLWDLLKQTQPMGDLQRLVDLIRQSTGPSIGKSAVAASVPQDTSPFGNFQPTQFPRHDYRSPLSSFSIPEMNPEWQAFNHIMGIGTRANFAYADGGMIDNLPVPDELDVPHAAPAQPPAQPLLNAPQATPPASGGGGGGGGGGIGDIANLAMTLLPMLLKDGGAVGLMRGGYPELRTAPIRHQFDSGGQSYVDGSGDGRADDIDARLSSGEWVADAETVAMVGNGNSDAGARKLDEMRRNIRKHKGKALMKGKFSPNAKSPMDYLIGSPQSDGIRRLGKKQ